MVPQAQPRCSRRASVHCIGAAGPGVGGEQQRSVVCTLPLAPYRVITQACGGVVRHGDPASRCDAREPSREGEVLSREEDTRIGSNLSVESPKSGILVTEVMTFDKIAPWVILGRS